MTLLQFAPAGVLVILAVVVAFIILVISRIFGPHHPSFRKNAPYESGMKPIGPANRRLPIKFYLVAVLFIVFDVEVIFLFPIALAYSQLSLFAVVLAITFVLILLLGLFLEWRKGALEWS